MGQASPNHTDADKTVQLDDAAIMVDTTGIQKQNGTSLFTRRIYHATLQANCDCAMWTALINSSSTVLDGVLLFTNA